MQELTIKVTIEELNTVLVSLSKMPYEAVSEVLNKVRTQGQQQVNTSNEAEKISAAAEQAVADKVTEQPSGPEAK